MRARTLVVLMALVALPSFSKDKQRDWQTGKLVSLEEGSAERVGYVSRSQNSVVGGYSECRNWLYSIETDTITYVFSAHTGAWCANHPQPFTVGAQVKFVLEPKGKALLLEEDGKEYQSVNAKKAAKQAAH